MKPAMAMSSTAYFLAAMASPAFAAGFAQPDPARSDGYVVATALVSMTFSIFPCGCGKLWECEEEAQGFVDPPRTGRIPSTYGPDLLTGVPSTTSGNGLDWTVALEWLAKAQHPDGCWSPGGYEDTALALLAFLDLGHTERIGKYQDNVRMAIDWLVSRQGENGQIGPGAYEHALATLALSELYYSSSRLKQPAQRAVDRLLEMQLPRSGWPDSDGRASPFVSAWAVLALKSGRVAGLRFDPRCFNGLVAYLDSITADDGAVGPDGYPPEGEVHILNTAAAMYCRQLMGWEADHPHMLGAARIVYALCVGSDMLSSDGLFVRLFGSLAMINMPGRWWRDWGEWSRPQLRELIRTGPAMGGPVPAIGIDAAGRPQS